jgi:hypothetical protein
MIAEKLKCVSNKRYQELRKLKKLIRGPRSFIKFHGFHKNKANKESSINNVTQFWIIFDTSAQFHQHFTGSFYVRKLCTQLFCAYIVGLYFTGARLLVQMLRVER